MIHLKFKNITEVITRLYRLFLSLNAVLLTIKKVSGKFFDKKNPTLGKVGHIKQKLFLWRIRS